MHANPSQDLFQDQPNCIALGTNAADPTITVSQSGGPIHDPTCQGWDGMEIKCIDSEKSVVRMTDKWLT